MRWNPAAGMQRQGVDEFVGGQGHDLLPIGAAAAIALYLKVAPASLKPMRRPLEIATPWG